MKNYICGLVFLLFTQGTIANSSNSCIKIVNNVIYSNFDENDKIVSPGLEKVSLSQQSKWVPDKIQSSSVSEKADEFLKTLHGKMRLLFCQYNDSKLVSKTSFSENQLKVGDAIMSYNVSITPVKDENQEIDLNITFKLDKGIVSSSGVGVAFDFSNWTTDNYVLLPASVYNGNRHKLVEREYAAGLDRKYLYQKDIPMMSVPIPQLSPTKASVSRLEVNASNLATPAICFYSKELKRGFIILSDQKTQFEDNGFIVEESPDRKSVSLVITAPGVREKKPLFVGFTESTDRGIELTAGDEINLNLRLYSFEAYGIPEFLDKFMQVRKKHPAINNPRDLIPFSQVADWMTERINARWYAGEDFEFYCPENANWISFGWIGGLINTFPMLALGDQFHLDRVTKTFDFAIPRAQGEAGYFYGALNSDGKVFGREGYDEFPEIVLTRKNADVLFWMIKQFELLRIQGREKAINPDWERNIHRLAEAFVSTWEKNSQWGRMLNNQSGEVAEFNTSGGVMAIGGLALASEYFGNPEYLIIAKEAADFYYKRDFEAQGMTNGGCADILHNADSETAAGFMTSLMALYEITGEKKWLEKSRQLANLVATWTTSYDYELPVETELGQLGAKLSGIYWASTQNKHGAPGICTGSGDALFKIYRATGNTLYSDLLKDIIHAHAESIRRGGYTNERLTYCDAESRGERGTHVTGWNELNGFLMALEIPGIYLQTDNDELYIFDHVEAKVVKRDNTVVTLEITNPTKFNAEVAVFAEKAKYANIPSGNNAFVYWPKVKVKAGDTALFQISMDGKVINSL